MDSRLISNMGAAIHPAQLPTDHSSTRGYTPHSTLVHHKPRLNARACSPCRTARPSARLSPDYPLRAHARTVAAQYSCTQTEPQSTSQVHCPLTVTPYPSTASTQSVVHTGCTLPAPAQRMTKAANTLGLPRTPSRSTPPHQHSAHAPDNARSIAASIACSQSPPIPAQSLHSLLFTQAAHYPHQLRE